MARRLFGAFQALRALHELALLLDEAKRLALPAEYINELASWRERLTAFSLEELEGVDVEAERAAVGAFLRSLRPFSAVVKIRKAGQVAPKRPG
ncbi:MAG: hypothetical protein QM756_34035 [Polyangiaceae bacterium]